MNKKIIWMIVALMMTATGVMAQVVEDNDDDINEDDKTDGRIDAWIAQLGL